MRRLGNTVARLTAANRAMQVAIANDDGRLEELTGFGSNPGSLSARIHIPDNLSVDAPLVVLLHGCTQNASVYDRGSGWSSLADRHGFALLYPEQRRANNSNLCFNWYDPSDARRGRGEALSIRQMVDHMIIEHDLDPARVFITGLSAGGAMTSVMLATYPELFAGGAIIAGLPFASANNLGEALERMRGHGAPTRKVLAARAKAAADRPRHTPTLSVWHGTSDRIVDPVNATEIVDQWRDLHHPETTDSVVDMANGHRREVWMDKKGRVAVEKYEIRGMGHGIPIDTRSGDPCGTAGPHMLEANICSTSRIAAMWGIGGAEVRARAPKRAQARPLKSAAPVRKMRSRAKPSRVGAIIEDALRSAGLMR